MSDPRPVRLADLLALPTFGTATVLATETAPDRLVRSVITVEAHTALSTELAPSSVVILVVNGQAARWDHLIELLVRRTASVGAVGVIAPSPPGPVPASIPRVAARLRTPVVLHDPELSGLALAVQLELAVRDHRLGESGVLLRVAGALGTADSDPTNLLRVAADELDAKVALVDTTRVRLGHQDLRLPRTTLEKWTRPDTLEYDGRRAAIMPVVLTPEPVWLIAEREAAGPLWPSLARDVLALIRGDLVAWITRERIAAERKARTRSLVLDDLTHRGTASPGLAAAAAELGWVLAGWHVGFHICVQAGKPAELWEIEEAAAEIRRDGIDLQGLVARSNGWAAWLDWMEPPNPEVVRRAMQEVRARLDTLRDREAGRAVVVGVGSPQSNAEGLGRTLREAREAAQSAGPDPRETSVRAVQDLGASQLLVGWYGSQLFTEAAHQVLGPLLDDEDTLRTLESYLERACSTAQTARALNLHRNTVTQRLAKVERLLGVSLAAADTRLALQLALRARRSRTTPPRPGR
ncbi:helix-turn-helix domain-containing protein [Kribbella sancticallisti]|uniref:Helix-turn-helix domain-containing protein n=1 Tax=Kribbella sancticallisti TaxID=460087 RepID=A0ABP4MZW2_9ACTN